MQNDPDTLTEQQQLRMKTLAIIEHASKLPRHLRTLYIDHIVASGVANGYPIEHARETRQRLLDFLRNNGLL